MDRQPIVDRNGVILAANLKIASLYADPRKILNPAEAALRIAQVLPDLSAGELQTKLASGRSFIWLKRGLTPREQYEVNRLGIPGLYFHDEQRRVYPQGSLAVHVLGFTYIDGNGIAGIEKSFDEQLRDPARTGDPLQPSLDIRVQHIVRDELARAVETFQAIGAGAIVMDIYTGEVISLVRSEEHTSELQSLMRISYAVFCLKKKKQKQNKKKITLHNNKDIKKQKTNKTMIKT